MPDIDRIDAIGPPDLLPDLALSRTRHDRVAELRSSPAAVAALAAEASTAVLLVRDGTVPVTRVSGGLRLALVPAALVPGLGTADRVGIAEVPGSPDGGSPAAVPVLLGRVDGRSVLALLLPRRGPAAGEPGASAPGEPPWEAATRALPADVSWAGLRDVGEVLSAVDVGLAVEAVALDSWHATHPRCPRCGSPTLPAGGGHERRCPVDGSTHHPRSDPAVIMLVLDAGDRLLLARQVTWPPGRMSLVAGFVEPGESLENAVRRETAEEVGVLVGDVRYLASQPWPFPASLMLGFRAQAVTTEIRVDGVEISEARWASREELTSLVASGELTLPPRLSIARRMIEWWLGREVEVPGTWR